MEKKKNPENYRVSEWGIDGREWRIPGVDHANQKSSSVPGHLPGRREGRDKKKKKKSDQAAFIGQWRSDRNQMNCAANVR